MEKINIAELLRNCPSGMELDCTMFENVTFIGVGDIEKQFPIEIKISGNKTKYLTKTGCFHDDTLVPEAKCVIFPKGKTTWEGFVPPCQFKDGDIVAYDSKLGVELFIFKEFVGNATAVCYLYLNSHTELHIWETPYLINRLATEEEKAKLFQAIKDNGYKWNPKTKTLEKIEYQYPKTYEECCEVFEDNFLNVICLSDDEKDLFYNIIKMKRCRDAYWRLYGEQMGLGKPWKPDFLDDEQLKFCLYNSLNNILPGEVCETNEFLVFPTEEMRDEFFKNFKDLIEQCKELL